MKSDCPNNQYCHSACQGDWWCRNIRLRAGQVPESVRFDGDQSNRVVEILVSDPLDGVSVAQRKPLVD